MAGLTSGPAVAGTNPGGLAARVRRLTPQGLLFYLLLIVGSIVVWQLVAALTRPIYLPSPTGVLNAAIGLTKNGLLVESVRASYQRILIGWTVGCLVGAPMGLLMGRSRVIHAIVDPYLQLLRFLTPIALLSLVVLWIGAREEARIFLVGYATVFVVAINTMDGALRVEKEKVRAAQCLGASSLQILRHVVVPATMPYTINGMRLAIGNSFMAIVSAEMLASESGLGFLIYNGRQFLLTANIFVGLIALGICGLVTDRILRYVVVTVLHRYQVKV